MNALRVLVAVCALVATSGRASAATWALKDPATDLSIAIGALDAQVCVVHPAALRSAESCADVDVAAIPLEREGQKVAILSSPAWSGAQLQVVVLWTPRVEDGDWSAREAREARDLVTTRMRAALPEGVHGEYSAATEVRLQGAQAFLVRSRVEYPGGITLLERRYLVVGRTGFAAIAFTFAEDAKDTLAPVVDAIVASISVPPARSVTSRLVASAASVATPIPVAVLAAVAVARRRKEKRG